MIPNSHLRDKINALWKELFEANQASIEKVGYWYSFPSILNAYREADISFNDAVEICEKIGNGELFKGSNEGKRKVCLTLPFPPTTNQLFATFIQKNGGQMRRVPTDKAKKYREKVHRILQREKHIPFEGLVKVVIKLFRPQQSGDWDNFTKAPIDALKRTDKHGELVCYWGLLHDDKQVKEGQIFVYDDCVNPRLELEIEEL